MRVASERFGTAVMKEHEALLFAEVCLENGSSIEDAIADMRMIDTLLHAEILQKSVGKLANKTVAGYHRKGSEFYTTINKIIEGRINNAF